MRPRLVVSMLKHFLQYAKQKFDIAANNGAPTSGISDEEKDERGHKSSDETIWFGCDKLGTGCEGRSRQCEQFKVCLPLLKTLHAHGSLVSINASSKENVR